MEGIESSKSGNSLASIFSHLPQQGPGDDDTTLRMFRLLQPYLDPIFKAHEKEDGIPLTEETSCRFRVIDLGCGSGRTTRAIHNELLSQKVSHTITAVDRDANFVRQLSESLTAADVDSEFEASEIAEDLDELHIHEKHRENNKRVNSYVSTLCADMSHAELILRHSVDLLWAEGSLYSIGFDRGVTLAHGWLREGKGLFAATELTWLTDSPDAELAEFWQEGYPGMSSVAGNIETLQCNGFQVLGHYLLPASSWWNGYYTPLKARISRLPASDSGRQSVMQEIEFFEKFGNVQYGYVFYLAQSRKTHSS